MTDAEMQAFMQKFDRLSDSNKDKFLEFLKSLLIGQD